MLSNKPVLIIISLAISLSLWLYVTGQVDPETKAKITNVSVTVTNEEQLAEKDLAVLQNGQLTTSATIQGKRSYVNKAKKSGMKAYVDVSEAKEGVNELNLEFETPTGVTVNDSTDAVYTLTVEKRVTKEVPVDITFTGETSSELTPFATEVDPETITISGAKSSVENVEHAVAEVDKSEVTEASKTIESDLSCRSKEGVTVNGMVMSRDTVLATVRLLSYKEVTVQYNTRDLAHGLEVSEITGPETVQLLGDSGTLAGITHIVATVDLKKVKESGVIERDIDFVLPYGTYMYQDNEEKAKVTVTDKQ